MFYKSFLIWGDICDEFHSVSPHFDPLNHKVSRTWSLRMRFSYDVSLLCFWWRPSFLYPALTFSLSSIWSAISSGRETGGEWWEWSKGVLCRRYGFCIGACTESLLIVCWVPSGASWRLFPRNVILVYPLVWANLPLPLWLFLNFVLWYCCLHTKISRLEPGSSWWVTFI